MWWTYESWMIEIFEFDEVVFDEWWMKYLSTAKYTKLFENQRTWKTKNRKLNFMKYLSMSYTWNRNLWEYNFFNCIFKQTDKLTRTV